MDEAGKKNWINQIKRNARRRWFHILRKRNVEATPEMVRAFNAGFRYGWKARTRWDIKQYKTHIHTFEGMGEEWEEVLEDLSKL